MGPSHSFTVSVAKVVGERKAVILTNFGYWHGKNSIDEQHIYDGHVWLYNSIAGFTKVWSYLTEKEIRTALESLEKDGYLITGNYNKFKADRTKWYALTEKACSLLEIEFMPVISHLPKRSNGLPKRANDLPKESNENCPDGQMSFAPQGEPIPLENPIEKPIEELLQPADAGAAIEALLIRKKFESATIKLEEQRRATLGGRKQRDDSCKSLKISEDFYDLLVNAFYDNQLAKAEMGEDIKYNGLKSHCIFWIGTQVRMGTESKYHPNFNPLKPKPSAFQSSQAESTPSVTSRLKTAIPD